MQRLDHLTERLEYAMQIVRNLEAVATTPELRAAYNAAQPQGERILFLAAAERGFVAAPCSAIRKPKRRPQPDRSSQTISGKNHGQFPAPWSGIGCGREEAHRGNRCRADQANHPIRRKCPGLHESIRVDRSPTRAELAGLPESARAMARASAASKGLPEPSWRFTLQAPSYLAVMTYLDDARPAAPGLRSVRQSRHRREIR